MKKFFLTLAITMVAILNNSYAQNSASYPKLKRNNIHVSYGLTKLVNSGCYDWLNGFNIGYDRVNKLGVTPLMYEYGATLSMGIYDQNFGDSQASAMFVDLRIPLSLSYKFNVPGTSIGIMPVAGMDLGAYLFGEAGKVVISERDYTQWQYDDYFGQNTHTSRFIFDFHLGTRFLITNLFYIEYRYEGPFTPIKACNDVIVTARRHNFGIGFLF